MRIIKSKLVRDIKKIYKINRLCKRKNKFIFKCQRESTRQMINQRVRAK